MVKVAIAKTQIIMEPMARMWTDDFKKVAICSWVQANQ